MRVHKINTEDFPTLIDSLVKEEQVPENSLKLLNGHKKDPAILVEKYSYIIQSLISFEKEVNGLQKIEKILDVLKKNLKLIIPLKSSDLFFFDENKSELKSLIEEFDYTLYKSVNRFYKEGVLQMVFERKSGVIIPDLDNLTASGSEINFIIFPIIQDNVQRGVFAIKSTVTQKSFSEIDNYTLQILIDSSIAKIERLFYKRQIVQTYSELQTYQAKLSNDFRLSAIGELTEGILEDITSPLQVIVSLVDLLDVDETNSIEINKIKAQVNKINKSVNRLVRFTNLNHKDVQLSPINLNKTISDYYKIVKSTLDSAKIECVLDLEESIPSILSHSNYVNQILTNLFGIVRKETKKNSGMIIQTRFSNNFIVLRFISTIQLKKEDKEKGLNFKIIQNLVKKHEGKLLISESENSGSIFEISIPLVRKIRV